VLVNVMGSELESIISNASGDKNMFFLAAAVRISSLMEILMGYSLKTLFGVRRKLIFTKHRMVMVSAKLRCPVFPSEDPEKVKNAILRIFPAAELTETERGFEGETDIGNFSTLIRKQKILDSTRNMMFKGVRGDRITIHLNKQVATVGKVSFTEPRSILGTLEVTIECDDPEALIDRVAPVTVDGVEVRA
jgi:Uncharacterized protein conserved in archaea